MADPRVNGRESTITLRHTAPTVYRNFPRSVLGLAIFQTICGAALFITGIMSIVSANTFGVLSFSCSVWVILAGSFGIAAGIQKTVCEIVSSMIFSIIAGINSIVVAVSIGKSFVTIGSHTENTGNEMQTGNSIFQNNSNYNIMNDSNFGLCIALMVFAVAEAFASIAMSAIGCQFSCFCCRNCCCNYDMTITEKGIISEGQDEQLLQPMAQTAIPTAYVVTSQHQTTYQPPAPAAFAVGGVTGNNTWLQNKYTRLDDEMLAA